MACPWGRVSQFLSTMLLRGDKVGKEKLHLNLLLLRLNELEIVSLFLGEFSYGYKCSGTNRTGFYMLDSPATLVWETCQYFLSSLFDI